MPQGRATQNDWGKLIVVITTTNSKRFTHFNSIVLLKSADMSNVYQHSTVQCLTAVAQHHGVAALPERLIHDFALAAEEPASRLVVRMATELGFKAEAVKLSWQDLVALVGDPQAPAPMADV